MKGFDKDGPVDHLMDEIRRPDEVQGCFIDTTEGQMKLRLRVVDKKIRDLS
jgi:hypothetical protein